MMCNGNDVHHASRKKEVLPIMTQRFDQKKATEIREYNLAQQAKLKGRLEGKREGEHQKALEIAKNLLAMGMAYSTMAKGTGLLLEKVEALANGS